MWKERSASVSWFVKSSIIFCLLFWGCGQKQTTEAPAGGGKKVIIKLASVLPETHPVHKAFTFFSQKVKEKTNGKLEVKIFPNAQLGNERDTIENVQLGNIQMVKVSAGTLGSFTPKMAIFDFPYLFKNQNHMHNVLDSETGKTILTELEKVGLKGLTYYDAGSRSVFTSKRPITKLEDLKGLKIRTLESKIMIESMNALGANATPMAWGELYSALQQGVVDGAENNPQSLLTGKFYEVCKYYSITEHFTTPDILLIGLKFFKSLSPSFQNAIQEAANESTEYQRKIWKESTDQTLAELKTRGVKINTPDTSALRAAVQPVYVKHAKSVDENLIQAILKTPDTP